MSRIACFILAALALVSPAFSGPIGKGVACIPNCGDGAQAVALARQGEYLVLALDADATNVAKARSAAEAAGLLGRSLYVQPGTADRIPFADHYVDLLLLEGMPESALSAAQKAEILRVLSPIHGRAVLKDKTIVQSELSGSDWWTHKRHGPDNNPVSRDTVFQFPPILQYRAMPTYTSAHGASLTGNGVHYEINDWLYHKPWMVSLCGRIFARNVYNGRLLWEAEAPQEHIPAMPTAALIGDDLFLADGQSGDLFRYKGLTGQRLPNLKLAEPDRRIRWFAHQDGIIYALIGGPAEIKKPLSFYVPPVVSQWEEHSLHGKELIAYELSSSQIKWRHVEPGLIDYRNVAVHANRLYFYVEKARLACLDLATGQEMWENQSQDWIAKMNRPARPHNVFVSYVPSLMAADGILSMTVAECRDRFAFDAATGEVLAAIPGSPVKSVILNGEIHVGPGGGYDPRTGDKTEAGLTSPAGMAWCGLTTYAPGTGLLGHSTLQYKSACAVGAWVAGGILTYSPSICDCGGITGAGGFASGGDLVRNAGENPEHPLVKGPSFAKPAEGKPDSADAWTAYRGGRAHRGSSPATVGAAVRTLWTAARDQPFAYSTLYNKLGTSFDERPTPPIIVGDAVFLAGSDGIVQALHLRSGTPKWTFHADGPVFTPPAHAEGLLFVPGCDGWIYALDAVEGSLAWKRRLAPLERRILVFDQLVSNWPVLSLVVDDRVVYASAGYHVTDGVKTFALDARTGDIRWSRWHEPAETSFAGSHNPPDRPVQGIGGHMTIVKNRIWGAGFFSTPLSLDRTTGEDHLLPLKQNMVGRTSYYAAKALTFMRGQDVIALADGVVLAGGGDLFENQHLREGKNNRTVYRLYLTDQQGDWTLEPSPPPVLYTRIAPAADDRLIAFTGPLYELNKGRRRLSSAAMFNAGLHVWPLERFLATAKALQKNSPIDKDLTARRGMLVMRNPHQVEAFDDLDRSAAEWQKPELDINATALSADAVLVAHATGTKDLYGYHFDEQTQRQPMAQFDGWQLSALRRENGETLWAVPLPAEPLYNGLAIAADGSVIVTLRDGASVAVGKP